MVCRFREANYNGEVGWQAVLLTEKAHCLISMTNAENLNFRFEAMRRKQRSSTDTLRIEMDSNRLVRYEISAESEVQTVRWSESDCMAAIFRSLNSCRAPAFRRGA